VNFSAKAAVTASTSTAPLAKHPLFFAIERSPISSRKRFAAISTCRNPAHNNSVQLTCHSLARRRGCFGKLMPNS